MIGLLSAFVVLAGVVGASHESFLHDGLSHVRSRDLNLPLETHLLRRAGRGGPSPQGSSPPPSKSRSTSPQLIYNPRVVSSPRAHFATSTGREIGTPNARSSRQSRERSSSPQGSPRHSSELQSLTPASAYHQEQSGESGSLHSTHLRPSTGSPRGLLPPVRLSSEELSHLQKLVANRSPASQARAHSPVESPLEEHRRLPGMLAADEARGVTHYGLGFGRQGSPAYPDLQGSLPSNSVLSGSSGERFSSSPSRASSDGPSSVSRSPSPAGQQRVGSAEAQTSPSWSPSTRPSSSSTSSAVSQSPPRFSPGSPPRSPPSSSPRSPSGASQQSSG